VPGEAARVATAHLAAGRARLEAFSYQNSTVNVWHTNCRRRSYRARAATCDSGCRAAPRQRRWAHCCQPAASWTVQVS